MSRKLVYPILSLYSNHVISDPNAVPIPMPWNVPRDDVKPVGYPLLKIPPTYDSLGDE